MGWARGKRERWRRLNFVKRKKVGRIIGKVCSARGKGGRRKECKEKRRYLFAGKRREGSGE